jgi:hypothetical protein
VAEFLSSFQSGFAKTGGNFFAMRMVFSSVMMAK